MKVESINLEECKPLADFDYVAHVVPISNGARLTHGNEEFAVHALFINKYGCEVGAIVGDLKSGRIMSWDHNIWDEFINCNEDPFVRWESNEVAEDARQPGAES